jgi:hypothetical protein
MFGNNVQLNQQTIDAVVAVLKGGPSGVYVPGTGLVQKDVTQATGLVAYNLEAPSKLLVPVMSPLRNRIPRKNDGAGTAAEWKIITSLDTARTDIFTAEGTKAATVNITVTPKSAGYRTISKGDNNTFQSQWAGKGFEDVKARNILRLLAHVMIMEEMALLGADTTLAAVTAPTVVSAASGGSIADGTYSVICRAETNIGRGRKSTNTSTGALAGGGDNVITASVPVVDGAVRYEWYVGTAGSERLEATTTINSVSLTALAGTGALASATADDHTDALAFQGLIRQITDNGVKKTLATGTNGTGTALALTDVDDLLQDQWDTWRANPDAIVVNSDQAIKLTKLVLAANGAPTMFMTSDASAIGNMTGGYRLTKYVSPVTGKPLDIITHPYLASGTLLTLSFDMPFPGGDIDNVMEVQTRQEYMQIDYPLTSPKWEYEVLVDEVLKLYFPGSCGVIRNINGV